MKKIYLTIVIALIYTTSYGQSKPLLGQYFQNLPAFAPALTGANDYLDIRLSYRQQWVGFEGAPRTVYLSAYSSLKSKEKNLQERSLRLEEKNEASGTKLKHGIGGYLQSNEEGPFKQLDFNLNYAVHVPVFHRTYLSFGVSAGLNNEKIDIADITVKNGSIDQTYQSWLNDGTANTYLNLQGGFALNSDHYYVAYSTVPFLRTFLSGNENVYEDEDYMRHQIATGGRLYLNQDVELIPNGFVRIDKAMPLLFDAGMRVRYQQKYWTGVSYRNTGTIIGMLGLNVNDLWNLSYSYEYGVSDLSSYNSGTHEIVLGIQLFNYKRYTSMW